MDSSTEIFGSLLVCFSFLGEKMDGRDKRGKREER
jgi:hypothetical protein